MLTSDGPLLERLLDFLTRLALPLAPPAIDGLRSVVDEDSEAVVQHASTIETTDIAALCAAYPLLESWEQKVLMVQLTDQHTLPSMRDMWQDMLWIPTIRPQADSHRSVAKALAHLDGDSTTWERYWTDVLLTRREARKRAARN